MVRTCPMPMTDADQQLEARDTIFFVGTNISLQNIERQVERLGFGELYIVSATQGRHEAARKIRVQPLAAAA
jgi:hypothetical protein